MAAIGQILGHYRIESKLGEGGMGVVYRAFDSHLERLVAIKVLRQEAQFSLERKRRFVQEAKAASALNYPNIITIYDIGRQHGVHLGGKPLKATARGIWSPISFLSPAAASAPQAEQHVTERRRPLQRACESYSIYPIVPRTLR
jgi:serine/threonine protein kinase